MIINKCQLIRQSCQSVVNSSTHVKINYQKIPKLIDKFQFISTYRGKVQDFKCSTQQILLYIFTLNSLNFCFWPVQNFQYSQLVQSVRKSILNGMPLEKLAKINQKELIQQVFQGVQISQTKQRTKILNHMATIILTRYNGSFEKLVKQADKSAVELLNILTNHAIYKGEQVYFYKRGQIIIRDVWAQFNGKGIGQFNDIDQLTVFPDYRIPQLLNQQGIFEYIAQLSDKVKNKILIPSGSEMQCEIRASTVVVTQIMKEMLAQRGLKVNGVQLDIFLWETGQSKIGNMVNHHRTLTIYY